MADELQGRPHAAITVSVIIPTYNRPEGLLRLLDSLRGQTFPAEEMEIIVVDDGSTCSYIDVMRTMDEMNAVYLQQPNSGEAVARNTGVAAGHGELLILLDDDMVLSPGYLAAMTAEHRLYPREILIGNMQTVVSEGTGAYARVMAPGLSPHVFGEVPFTEALGGVMGIARNIYLSLGGQRPVPDKNRGGWIDLDFSYRAYLAGYSFRRVQAAMVTHHDWANRDLQAACRRAVSISRLAPALFQIHPGLAPYLPMFRDMHPIRWGKDSPRLVMRKMLRALSASRWAIQIMAWLTGLFETQWPVPAILRRLYRWLQGAHIFRGYRDGIKQIKMEAQ